MAINLYEHQIKALNEMKNGCILNGGVGSGKSITSLGYFYLQQGGTMDSLTGGEYKWLENPQDLYIITTARKRDTLEWEKELIPFLLSKHPEATPYKNTVVIDSWNNIKKYSDIKGAFFIFDEDRVVGNGTWVKSFLKISKFNNWILLSATPGDTWQDYIPVFIANGFYKNITEFKREHIIYSQYVKYPKIDRYINTGRLVRLRNSILVDMDFKRLTVPHHEDIYVDYDRDMYKMIIKNRWNPFDDEPIKTASEFCYLLRKIVNTCSSRQDAVIDILEKHPKVIIFYNFDYELGILKQLFENMDITYAEWNGHRHQDIPDGDKWAYLVQYTAGCEGWNCVKTDTIIFYSQNYSYKVMTQASGRIDRLNTPFIDLYYYHLKSRSGIDLAISKALSEKKKFNEGSYTKKRNISFND